MSRIVTNTKIRLKKHIFTALSAIIFISSFIQPTYAAGNGGGGGNINISDSIVFITINMDDWMWDWEYEPNFRTMQILDVITFVNEHAQPESNADYRPDLKKDVENLYEYSLADIKEKLYFEEGTIRREPVTTVDGKGDYSSKLRYLIDQNVVSRDAAYQISRYGSKIYKDIDMYTNQDVRSEKVKGDQFRDPTIVQPIVEVDKVKDKPIPSPDEVKNANK